MQKQTSYSNKRKNSGDGLAKFERAQRLFQDIESIIDQEIATTPIMAASYDNIARVKKTRRKQRPGLIRNFNSRKNRQVINNMEYDPESNSWLGNEDALSVFSPLQPALIINKGRLDKEKVVGGMTWDPVERVWKGNDVDMRKFDSPRKPALITPLRGSSYLQKEVQGMVFDPMTMRWVGNDQEVDIFSQIDKLDDDGFAVGDEFHLPAALAKSFVDCANRHKASLSGWFADGAIDKKAHLYAIRNMSILRIVRDVKQRNTYPDFEDDVDANVPERDVPSPSRDNVNGNGNSADASEDYDDLPFTGSAKLKLPEIGEDDWDKDFDMDADVPSSSSSSSSAHRDDGSNKRAQQVPSKKEDEDWDSDFAEADADALKSKLKLPSSLPLIKKPFQIFDGNNKRGSVIDLSNTRLGSKANPTNNPDLKTQQQATKPTKVVVEEDDEGFDLPPGPIRLVPKKMEVSDLNNEGDSELDDLDSENAVMNVSINDIGLSSEGDDDDVIDDEEEEEEDWNDVDVPPTFPSAPVKRAHNEYEDWDKDNDIEVPSNELVLKKRAKTSDDEAEKPVNGNEDDELGGIEIPADFVARLKK